MERRGADWLAAYALGLAFSAEPEEACVQRLVDAAEDAQALEVARGRVLGVGVGDEVTRRRAADLLDRAVRQLRKGINP
ncbi:MAG: hypothetical protein M3O70_16865 [Actinomycetota bacterium]|nr:hypothetical protein [Actinomycetota bacterium]